LFVLGGCVATQPLEDVTLETSLEIVNQAIDEGKIISCFMGINEDKEVKKGLAIREDGCLSFGTEEELKSFCVADIVTVDRCEDYVRVTDGEEGVIYYDAEGMVVAEVEEDLECAVTVECEVEVEGVETEKQEIEGDDDEVTGEEVEGEEDGDEGEIEVEGDEEESEGEGEEE